MSVDFMHLRFSLKRFDADEEIHRKCRQLADWLLTAKKVVVHTGAGISTSAGIPDFR